MLRVPQFDFTTLKFSAEFELQLDFSNYTVASWKWAGPSQRVQNIAQAVSGLGQILPITPPVANASWTLDFWGPALQCNDVTVNEQDGDQIYTSLWNSYYKSLNSTGNLGLVTYTFLSWVPWSYGDNTTYDLNFTSAEADQPFVLDLKGDFFGPSSSSVSTGGPASLFIAVLPDLPYSIVLGQSLTLNISHNGQSCAVQTIQNLTEPLSCYPSNMTITPGLFYENSTLLRCELANMSYALEFSYSSGKQDIRILPSMAGNLPVIASSHFVGRSPYNISDINNSSLIISNITTSAPANCSIFLANPYYLNNSHIMIDPPCVVDISAVRLQSYQGIMAAFNQLVLGSLPSSSSTQNSMIMNTILAQTDELTPLRDWKTDPMDLQSFISSTGGWGYPGLVGSGPPSSRGDLKSTLEQLFQNFTISLLAEPYFQ